MSERRDDFVLWEEHIVCPDRGNRVVHYVLRDASGSSLLAVVGTERSIRHMMYVPTDEFVQVYGSQGLINSSTKWRARREVVDLLNSLVPSSVDDLEGALATSDGMALRKLKCLSSEIDWCGTPWSCTKLLKHYPALRRKETTVAVHSFASIMAEEGDPYVGYVEDMYEDKKGLKRVKVRWFHHSKEVQAVIPHLVVNPGEVFITPHVQVISGECVYGPATVLTPTHFEKCLETVSNPLQSGILMCSRQLKNKKVKPFALTKLRGYGNQAILSSIDIDFDNKPKTKENQVSGSGRPIAGSSPGGCLSLKSESVQPKLKLKLPGTAVGSKHAIKEQQFPFTCRIKEKIEVLSQDSGIRGCWFRCQIMQKSEKRLKLRYSDVEDAANGGKLEEWVPACREANPDKLGNRCHGRLTIRPCPPRDFKPCTFELGAPVDAWWCDGWWEGVVIGTDCSMPNNQQVYFPDEDRLLSISKKNLRISKDWVDGNWVEVKAKPDILQFIISNASDNVKLSLYSILKEATGHSGSGPGDSNTFTSKNVPNRPSAPRSVPRNSGIVKQLKQISIIADDGTEKSAVGVSCEGNNSHDQEKSTMQEDAECGNRLYEIADAVEMIS